ncbi:MAG TPA: DMT family transporter [Phycisphaerales bacterium]|nr:DMT family transporter [Phycisphaerales bacterium]
MTRVDLLQLLMLGAIWGGSYPFMRIATKEMSPPALVALRLVLATLFLLPWLCNRQRIAVIRQRWRGLLLLSAMNSAIPFMLLAYCTQQLSGSVAAIINATVPFFATLVAWAWLKDKPRSVQWAGLAVGFAGVIVLVAPKLAAGVSATALAVAAGLTAALLYAISASYTKKVLAGIEPMTIAAAGTMFAMVLALPIGLMTMPASVPSWKALGAAGMLGVVCTAIAYIIFYRLFASIGPTRAVTVTFLIPLFSVIWGVSFLDERITWNLALGGGLILIGMGLITGLFAMLRGRRAGEPVVQTAGTRTDVGVK